MKTFFIAFLVAVICTDKVHSLVCYHCENEPSNWNCQSIKKCAESDRFCTTIKTVTKTGKDETDYRISKRCTPTCSEGFVEMGPSSVATNCCSYSLCNISGAVSVKMSSMVLVLGILASFLYIFQSG